MPKKLILATFSYQTDFLVKKNHKLFFKFISQPTTMKNIRKLDIGHTLIRYRYSKSYTQQFVANEFEISLTAYKKWEKKKDNFSILQLKRISALYNIPIELIIIDSYIDKRTRLIFNESTFYEFSTTTT